MSQAKSRRKAPPLKKTEIPEHILAEIGEGMSNPTAVGLGNSADPADATHFAEAEAIAALAAGDLPHWSAFDSIMMALIQGRNPAMDEAEAEEVLTCVKIAIDGPPPRGARPVADEELLFAVARRYAEQKLQSPDSEGEPSIKKIIVGLIGESYWGHLYRDEQEDTVYRRISKKFRADKARLLVMVTASHHPLQQERWDKTQRAIGLLRELALAP